MANYGLRQYFGRSLLADKSVMDNYQPRGLLDEGVPMEPGLEPPSLLGGLLSLDPTDYLTPGMLAKAGMVAKGLLGPTLLGGMMAAGKGNVPRMMRQSGQIVWHGSPHKFDKFDMSKIGTGEGAQAYGHGLYMAEAQEVGQTYAPANQKFMDKVASLIDKSSGPKQEVLEMFNKLRLGTGFGSPAGIKQRIERIIENEGASPEYASGMRKAFNQIEKQYLNNPGGYLYKLDIPDEAVARMLDWDKPLSQQAPGVQKYFEPMVAPIRAQMAKPADPGWGDLAAPSSYDPTGQELLSLLRKKDAQQTAQQFLSNGLGQDISAMLRQQGIPGIRYLDGGSRGAGAGTSNFVLFDDALARILERNGQATGNQPWKPGEWRGLLDR